MTDRVHDPFRGALGFGKREFATVVAYTYDEETTPTLGNSVVLGIQNVREHSVAECLKCSAEGSPVAATVGCLEAWYVFEQESPWSYRS